MKGDFQHDTINERSCYGAAALAKLLLLNREKKFANTVHRRLIDIERSSGQTLDFVEAWVDKNMVVGVPAIRLNQTKERYVIYSYPS